MKNTQTTRAAETAKTVAQVLGPLKEQLQTWRASRRKGQRIPPALWEAAVRAAAQFGVYPVMQELKLDYTQLKKRCDQATSVNTHPAALTFVEVLNQGAVPQSATLGACCAVELVSVNGAQMRVQLQGDAIAGALAVLSQTFWSAAS